MTDLSIIIINWNTKTLLQQCLESIHQSEADSEFFETIVVDNGSSDQSSEMVKTKFPWVKLVVNQENIGFAAANNQAVKLASGPMVLLLNSDTFVSHRAISKLFTFMESNKDVGVLGCQLLNADGSRQGSYANFPSIFSALLGTDIRTHIYQYMSTGAFQVDAVSGACLLTRKDAWNLVDGMDESFNLFVEEVDFCYRVQKAGWLVCFYPEVEITHFLGQSRKMLSNYSNIRIHQSRLLFFGKHYGKLQANSLRIGYIVTTSMKLVIYIILSTLRLRSSAKMKVVQNRTLLNHLVHDDQFSQGVA